MNHLARGLAAATLLTLFAGPAPARAASDKPALMCRPATHSERATAMVMIGETPVMLTCAPTQMMMADNHKRIGTVAAKNRSFGPNVDGLNTPAQIDAAWKTWSEETFHISAQALHQP